MVLALLLGAASLWADSWGLGGDTFDTLTGNFLKFGLNHNRGTLGSSTLGILFDRTGTGTFAGAPNFLAGSPNQGGNHFDYFGAHTDQTNSGNPMMVGAQNGVYVDNFGLSLTSSSFVGGIYDYIWNGTMGAATTGGEVKIQRELTFNITKPYFDFFDTLYSDNAATGSIMGIHYGEGFNPNPDMPVTPDTVNSVFINVSSRNGAAAAGSRDMVQSLGSTGGGGNVGANPYVAALSGGVYPTNPQTIWNGGVPFNAGNGDMSINIADSSAAKNGKFTVGDTFRYEFAQGGTPEPATFVMLAFSMVPLAGAAVRRRRKRA